MWNLHNIGKLRGSDMLAIERKNEILDKLRAEQRVLVSDLAEYYNVTEETIRRDLDKLEKEGYATKTYGGAILGNSTKTDLSYTIRNKTNVDAKNQIAALASRLIEDGDHLMLDDSSTSLYLAKKLKEKKNLTVITNSVELVVELNGIDGWTIILTGGWRSTSPASSVTATPCWSRILSRWSATRRSRCCGATTSTPPSCPARASTSRPG